MAWAFLLAAGVAEVMGTILLKYSNGFSKPLPTVLCLFFMIGSLGLLGLATRHVPISVAYVFWTGFGAFGAVVGGAVLFSEPLTMARIACTLMVVGGVVGLYLVTDA